MRKYAWVLLVYTLLSLLLTWPLAAHFTTHVPGDGIDDPALAWNLWWIKHSLVDQPQNPFACDWQFWPVGVNLAFYTLTILNGLFSLPLQAVFGLISAYNLLLLSSFVLSGFGGYLLCREVLGRQGNEETRRARKQGNECIVSRRRVLRVCLSQAVLRRAGAGQHRQFAVDSVRGAVHRARGATTRALARCRAGGPLPAAASLRGADLRVVSADLRCCWRPRGACGRRAAQRGLWLMVVRPRSFVIRAKVQPMSRRSSVGSFSASRSSYSSSHWASRRSLPTCCPTWRPKGTSSPPAAGSRISSRPIWQAT